MTRGVFFDLDGTLAHTAVDMLSALNRMRDERGMAPLSVDDVRHDISAGASMLLRKFLCDSEEEVLAHRQHYLDYYEETAYRETVLFDGIREVLDGIAARDGVWGVVTNKMERYAAPVARVLGIAAQASCLVCPDHCARGKPAPDPILLAMDMAGLAAGECAYVGDDLRDLQAANAAGVRFVAAGWGYWSVPDAREITVARTPAELVEALYPGAEAV